MSYTEANYENAFLEVFKDSLGFTHVYGPDIPRDYHEPLFLAELEMALRRINPTLPDVAITETIRKLRTIENGSLIQKNIRFMDYLQNGVSVNYFYKNEQRAALVQLVDYNNIHKNTYIVANQWLVVENSEKRPDIIVFLNGIPVVVIELKSPSREETDVSEAYLQLRNYMQEIPSLFVYNAFLVISDFAVSKAGTLSSGEDRFMEWKTVDGSYENTQFAQFDTLINGMFEKSRFLDILKNFLCFSGDFKILSAYHQYYAVKKAIYSTAQATVSDGKGGVFWHTQGSGKSLSMVFYAHLLQEALNSPTIVVLTDRNDLDDQLFGQFAKCSQFLRQTPIQAENRMHLQALLSGRIANGIIFTTAQKFEESAEELSDRRNIIVMADEAHRSQFIDEKLDTASGRILKTFGLIIRESLPNATYIGFTGTPISTKDRSTREVFGNYIDVYDMTQAVLDGATRPVYYESRVINLQLDQEILERIDTEYEILSDQAEPYKIEKSKNELSRMDSILGAKDTIDSLCADIVKHYEGFRQYELTGKAMIVAYSREIAMRIYQQILELRPEWIEKLAVVMTESNKDPEEWRGIIGNRRKRDELGRKFKDDQDPMKIAIVVDMWLTGFDVPSLATMYIYKPMSGHNLMQAIARVNRVFQDKEGGLIVDYVGIASALKQAMNDYTTRDNHNYGNMDISKTALIKFIEKIEVCRSLLYGFDNSVFLLESASDLERAKIISGGANYLTDIRKVKEKEAFIKEAMLLKQALSLCRSLLNEKQRLEAAYYEAVRTLLTRLTSPRAPLSLKNINDRINELLKNSIKSEGVINLFSDANHEFSLFDPKFLEEISRMKEKNIAVELLRKLLAEQVSVYKRNNLVKSEKFSEMLSRAMRSYLNGLISNEEVIEQLLKMAEDIANAQAEGDSLGLTAEELAFYDALTRPQAIKDFYQNEDLISLTQELTKILRENRTIDWQKKESARARMRRMVKKLLKKYKYPPEGLEDAVATVLSQCEMWTDAY